MRKRRRWGVRRKKKDLKLKGKGGGREGKNKVGGVNRKLGPRLQVNAQLILDTHTS